MRRQLLNRRDVVLISRELDREQPVIGTPGMMDVEEVQDVVQCSASPCQKGHSDVL